MARKVKGWTTGWDIDWDGGMYFSILDFLGHAVLALTVKGKWSHVKKAVLRVEPWDLREASSPSNLGHLIES